MAFCGTLRLPGACIVTLAFVACGGGGDDTGTSSDDTSTGDASTATPMTTTTEDPTTGTSTTTEDPTTGTPTTGDPTTAGPTTDTTDATETTAATPECAAPDECPGDECNPATCEGGVCGNQPADAGTPTADQTPGDCSQTVCDGAGGLMEAVDDADVPDAPSACTAGACDGGVPAALPLPAGEACAEGDGVVCDGDGACVACLADADCGDGFCDAGACVADINGCTKASATDLTGMPLVTINSAGLTYSPKCVRVSVGTTFKVNSNFAVHPFVGGVVAGGTETPDEDGPFFPATTMGITKNFALPIAGNYGFYCETHAQSGMTGAVFVE